MSSQTSPGKTVLIVEDNELNMKLFNDLLETQGYRVVQTDNGNDALSLVKAHQPDLVLMDIQLPGKSGLEVTSELKADPEVSHIPVIAVTAFAMKSDEERIRAGGCEDYLAKPISVPVFLEKVKRYLG
ncbi:response regulator [Parvularcula dongshanensis]|uniref:Two-component system cell cycle response regulator DivK n=1 Tax=Parvularcula dongshanensis TaxID=1173995 RepID=A0A840I5E9_9PROT|nr:response regulator [Parvularcula dongshanensis]MBB4659388.1 two-component system cell cycle response regulator DivK [Parvularcula dongshanensis]